MNCPHCEQPVFRKSESGAKLKLSRSVVVLSRSGEIEVNCPSCHRGVIVGQVSESGLRKAAPRLIVRV